MSNAEITIVLADLASVLLLAAIWHTIQVDRRMKAALRQLGE